MSEVIQFRGVTRHDLDPDTTLENTKGQLKHFVIIGYDKDDEFFFSSTMADGSDVVWMLELAKIKLFKITGDIE